MSDIKFNCPRCGTRIAVDTTGAGMTVACPNCSQATIVPSMAPQPPQEVRVACAGPPGKQALPSGKWWLFSVNAAAILAVGVAGGSLLSRMIRTTSAGVDKPVSPQAGTAAPTPAGVTNPWPFSTKAADAAKLPAGFPQGLVLYYNFDSPPTNGVVLDLSPSGNHGRATGVEWTAQGQRGGAFQFTGMNSAVRVPNHSSLNPEEITLAAWIKSDRREGGWGRIFDKNVSHGYALCVAADGQYVKSAGKLHWKITSEGREAVTLSDRVIADGRWHHVAATHDGREIHLYVDGEHQTKEAAILRQWKGRLPENDSDLTIGGNLAGEGFIGTIDEPMIFNRALSADEVHLLHQWSNRSAPVQGEGLVRAEGSSQRRWTNSLGMVFVPVPGTEVKFCIWETRVQDFEAFVRATGYPIGHLMDWNQKEHESYDWKNPGFAQGPDHPVVGVNWEDAKAFCRWLTKQEQEEGRLDRKQQYRLPGDAEWSRAVAENKYPWGDSWPPPVGAGNYNSNLGVDS
jgi:DNA-directed RNA polymerase subunit RPC12/RpoP